MRRLQIRVLLGAQKKTMEYTKDLLLKENLETEECLLIIQEYIRVRKDMEVKIKPPVDYINAQLMHRAVLVSINYLL